MTTFTSRRFNQDASGAKRAAADGPVFITDRGKPAHVLMTIREYRRLAGEVDPPRTIGNMLAMEGDVVEAFDEILEGVRMSLRAETLRPIDLD